MEIITIFKGLTKPIDWLISFHKGKKDKKFALHCICKEITVIKNKLHSLCLGLTSKKERLNPTVVLYAGSEEYNFFFPDFSIDDSILKLSSELEKIRGTLQYDDIDNYIRRLKILPNYIKKALYIHDSAPHKGREAFNISHNSFIELTLYLEDLSKETTDIIAKLTPSK